MEHGDRYADLGVRIAGGLEDLFPAEIAEAIMLRVVVFPTEPVTPITVPVNLARSILPISCRASTVFFTW